MTDVPAPRRACYGLRPGAPCPSYDEGTYPEGCDCMQLRNSFTGTLTRAGVIVGLIVFALLFCAIWLIVDVAYGADNAQPCLTKEQARAKWPTAWIYWHGMNHCWDNVRGTAATANKADGTVQILRAPKPNRATKSDMSSPLDASGNATARSISPITQGPYIYYPGLMVGGGTTSNMLTPTQAIGWQPVTDFDIEPVPFTPWAKARTLFDK
jgi:hypothetical protein